MVSTSTTVQRVCSDGLFDMCCWFTGGSWLRTVLSGRSVKEVAPPRPLSPDPVKAEAGGKPVVGAGQSHFEQPAAAAEIEAAIEEGELAPTR